MKSTSPKSIVRRIGSSESVAYNNGGGVRTDSVASEATLVDEDVEEVVREIPLPVARPRIDSSLYPKENLHILDGDEEDGEVDEEEEEHQEASGTIQTKHTVPIWFPKRVRAVFLVDRHGGQFTFKVNTTAVSTVSIDR